MYPLFFFIDRMCVCLYIYCIYPSFVFLSVCVRQKVPPLYTRTLSHTSGLLVTKKKFFLSLKKVNIYNKVSRYKIDQLLFTLVYRGDFYCVCIFIPHFFFFSFWEGKCAGLLDVPVTIFVRIKRVRLHQLICVISLKNKDIDRPRPPTMYIYRFRMNEIYTTIRCWPYSIIGCSISDPPSLSLLAVCRVIKNLWGWLCAQWWWTLIHITTTPPRRRRMSLFWHLIYK